ncbi:MAG: hypothetical protein RIT46_331 [Pseudomonadota bacterium]
MSSEPNPSAPFDEPRRRTITLDPSRGPGLVSALDFGDPSRPIDVVFFHANGFNALTYRSVLGPLSKQLRILAVDQRGHGQTTLTAKVEGRRSWDDHRYDDIAVLDALAKEPGFKPVVLSGHSMGSTVALYAAEARPALVRSVVMFDPVIMDKRTQFIGSLPWVGPDHWAKSPWRRARFGGGPSLMIAPLCWRPIPGAEPSRPGLPRAWPTMLRAALLTGPMARWNWPAHPLGKPRTFQPWPTGLGRSWPRFSAR